MEVNPSLSVFEHTPSKAKEGGLSSLHKPLLTALLEFVFLPAQNSLHMMIFSVYV